MILYWNLGSQPARAVKALLDIGKIPCDLVSVDIVKNEAQTPEFLNMNPFGKIPFMIDGGVEIGQSNAIMSYLCEKYSNRIPSHYAGSTIAERAAVNQYLSWYQAMYRPGLFKIIFLKVYGKLRKGIDFNSVQLASAEKQMHESLKQLNHRLKDRQYIATEYISIADLLVYFETTNLVYYDMEDLLSKYSHIGEWYQRMGKIGEVKNINDQWMKIAGGFKTVLKNIQPIDPKPKL